MFIKVNSITSLTLLSISFTVNNHLSQQGPLRSDRPGDSGIINQVKQLYIVSNDCFKYINNTIHPHMFFFQVCKQKINHLWVWYKSVETNLTLSWGQVWTNCVSVLYLSHFQLFISYFTLLFPFLYSFVSTVCTVGAMERLNAWPMTVGVLQTVLVLYKPLGGQLVQSATFNNSCIINPNQFNVQFAITEMHNHKILRMCHCNPFIIAPVSVVYSPSEREKQVVK